MLMHTGIISFCDRVRYNIKSSETKDVILNDLESRYRIRILQKHWYRLDDTTCSQLQRSPHWACLRSNGNPYYMYLTRFDDVNTVYFIDKKVQPGYEKPRIILGRGLFSDDLFNDTILDGEMVRRTDSPGWIFLVNDVIAYCGKSLHDVLLPDRISFAYEMFKTRYKPDPLLDVCSFSIKRFVQPTRDSVAELIGLSKGLPYTSRGMYFWCHHNRLKPKLYNFDDGLIRSVHRKVKDCPDFRDRSDLHSITSSAEQPAAPTAAVAAATAATGQQGQGQEQEKAQPSASMEQGERILWLRKTENPDVYDIFATQQCTEKMGNAYIPSLSTSKRLRSVFKDITVAMCLPFVCSYNSQFEKWTPVRQADMNSS